MGQRYLSDMEQPSKSCLRGAGGAPLSLPVATWLPGKTAPGPMSTCPDQRWWRGRSGGGNLLKGLHAQLDRYGRCLSQRDDNSMAGGRTVRTPTTEPTWKPWVPLTRRMEPKAKQPQSGRGSNLPPRGQGRVSRRMDLVDHRPWEQSVRLPRGSPRNPEYPVERHMSKSPPRSETWRPWPDGPRSRRLWDDPISPEAPPDTSSARIGPMKGRSFRKYRSRLWRLAQKVPRPLETPFARLWKPLFLMLRVLCNVMVKHRDTPDPIVDKFFNAVAILIIDDIHSVQIVTSPTSPKPRPDARGRPPPPLLSLWSWPPRVWGQQGVLRSPHELGIKLLKKPP